VTHVLGVDGGGSKTFAMIANEEGRILGFGRDGGSNHQIVGLSRAVETIEHASYAAMESAGIGPEEFAVASCCLAGADRPDEVVLLREALVEAFGPSHRVEVRNDTQAALRAGTRKVWGVVVACGSGFNAAGRAPDGQEWAFPARGWMTGDRYSGKEIAKEMIQLSMRAHDGRGSPTMLTELVLEVLGQPSPDELMVALCDQRIGQRDLLGLVPLVFEAAVQGDRVSQDLITRVGEELGISATAVIKRLGLQALPVEVVLAGSVFKGKGPLLIDTVQQIVHRTAPAATLVRLTFEPVVGAVLLGLESVGIAVDDATYSALQATMPDILHTGHRR
jgi:N-acetylglucosamine kinase-like BadF-type ATPase